MKAIQTTGASYVYICIASARKTCCQRRFPESESSSHFWSNLLVGKNMCTKDDRRWPVGLHGTPERFGKLVEYNRFDASFFSVHGKQAQVSSSPHAAVSLHTEATDLACKEDLLPLTVSAKALGATATEAGSVSTLHKGCSMKAVCFPSSACHYIVSIGPCVSVPVCTLCELWHAEFLMRVCRGWTRSCASCWSAPMRHGWTRASITARSGAAPRSRRLPPQS